METKIHREDPQPSTPPIEQVVIYLCPEEAKYLYDLFGRLSWSKIRDAFGADSNAKHIDSVHYLTSGIYSNLRQGGVGEIKTPEFPVTAFSRNGPYLGIESNNALYRNDDGGH